MNGRLRRRPRNNRDCLDPRDYEIVFADTRIFSVNSCVIAARRLFPTFGIASRVKQFQLQRNATFKNIVARTRKKLAEQKIIFSDVGT